MKIKTNTFGHEKTEEISEYVGRNLDGGRHGAIGQVEEAEATANNAASALGGLISLLADKGVLDASDVVSICNGYPDSEAEFEK